MRFTILGGSGFVLSRLSCAPADASVERDVQPRDLHLRGKNLGGIVYCIGLTGDFRCRPLATVESHVSGVDPVFGFRPASVLDDLPRLLSTSVASVQARP